MPAARGLKRTASKAEAKPVAGSSKIKKKPEAKVPLFNGDLVGPTKKGQVFTTGQGDVGQLGLGEEHLERSRFTHVKDLPSNIVDICAGGMHSVAIDKDGNVWTFGCNDEGALGRDTEEAGSEFTPRKVVLPGRAVAVSAGDSHSAALLHTFQVFAWGSFRDSHGNMGLTLKGNERTPIEMLPGQRVVQIASGGDHLVMLTDQGQVFTCGCGEQGQLGRVTARSCDRHSRLGLNGLLVPAPLVFCRDKADFDHIWAGTHCTFARKALRHDIYVWGLNNYQQIGVRKGSPQTVFAPVVAEAFKGAAWSKIAGGPHHSLALDEEGVCHALGRREYGRLGLGDSSEDAKELTAVPALKEKKCISISCGSAASFAVTDAGEIHVWGMGSSGQLGTGGEDDEAEPKLLATGKLEGRHCIRVSAGGQHTVLLVATEDEGEDEVPEPEKAVTAPTTKVEETPMETEEAQEEEEKEEPKKEDKKAEKKAKAEAKAEAKAAEAKAKEEKKEPRKAPAKRGRKASTASVEAKPAAVPMEDDTDAATAEAPSTAPAAESVTSAALPAVPEVPSESQDLPSVPEQTSSPATEDEAKEAEEPKAESGAALPTPEKIETPVATETPIAKEIPIAKETPIVSETTNAIETPIASETKETPIASESTNAKEAEITSETTNAKETPVTTTETPMEINNGSEEKIPEKEAAITNEPTVSEPTITTEKRERAGDDDNAEEPACKRARTELANGSARPMEGLSS